MIPELKVLFDPELTKTMTCGKNHEIFPCISVVATIIPSMMRGSFLWGRLFLSTKIQTGKQGETIKK